MLAMTNMMLHGIDVPSNIRHDNTLSKPLKDYGPKDRMDVIITNPPFGGVEEDGIEKNFPKKYQTRETADLFMALIMHLLRADTGRAGVVLPDGFLLGEGVKTNLKRELLREFNLHTIVRLPRGVFSPYTGINTNILFFDKGEPTKNVWFFEHPYPDGYKSYSRSKPLRIEEFDLEKKWWNNRKQSEYAWKVSIKEIEDRNYNLDFKNPHSVEFIHAEPEILVEQYELINNELATNKTLLKNELQKNREDFTFIKYFDKLFTTTENVVKLRKLILDLAVRGKLVDQNMNDIPINTITAYSSKIDKKDLNVNDIIKPFEIPKNWKWLRFGDIGETNIGLTYSPKDISENGTIVLRSSNVQNGKIDLKDLVRVDKQIKENLVVKENDILICARNGSKSLVGKAAIIQEMPESMTFGAFMAIYRTEYYEYVYQFLQSPVFRNSLENVGTTTINQITQNNLKNTIIPLPPSEEQLRIVKRIKQLFELCDKLEKNIEQSSKKQSQILNAVLAQV